VELDRYLTSLSVMGFNSAKFDINLIKKQLFTHAIHVGDVPSVVKKASSYMSVEFAKFKLLDCVLFMGVGISLVEFQKAWGVTGTKGE